MNLHEHLRDLVARQGPSVVDSAEGFRAALDDFLTEDQATTGELNLLVDAVRLGAVERLRSILDHGGDPRAAIAEAGDGFARDRGTDDVLRCRWAVAMVGYAVGRLQLADVPPSSVPATPPTASPPPPPPPPPPPSSVPPLPPGSWTAPTPRTFPETEEVQSIPSGPVPPQSVPAPHEPPWPPTQPRRRRGRVVLIGVLVAAVVAAAVLAGMWLGSRDDDPKQSADDTSDQQATDGPSTGDTGGTDGPAEGALSEDTVVVPVTDDQDVTRIYSIDVETGAVEPMTEGPNDRVPVLSPDRSTLLYSDMPPGESGRPMVMDLATEETRRLFATPGGCTYSTRPAFNPAGNRLAVVCIDEFGGYVAPYVVNLRGAYTATFPVDGEPQGSPTWTSPTTVVFVQLGATEEDPTTLWESDIDGTESRQLTDGSEGWDSHPDWSEEAGLLLYSRHEGPEPFGDLLTMDADREPGPGTDGTLWGHPAWSPDGTRVVFTMDEDGTERLFVASFDGDGFSEPTPLPELPGEPGVPAWGFR